MGGLLAAFAGASGLTIGFSRGWTPNLAASVSAHSRSKEPWKKSPC